MTSDTYVLLYECESSDYGYESVVLRLLPFNHPFGALLLHKGSRQAAEKRYYDRDIWRRYAKKVEQRAPRFIQELGWRREHVFWSSEYGAPSESHLLLHDSMQAWVAQQQKFNFHSCIFDIPKTLAGALRLDSDECGSEHITRDISAHHPAMYGADPVKHDTDSKSGQYWYEAGFECNSAYKAPLMDPDWFNARQLLRDIVLSCTIDEVKEALAAFHQCQAVYQFRRYRDELLRCLACRTSTSSE